MNNTTEEALKAIVDAWEVLPSGYHSYESVHKWLINELYPTICVARYVLKQNEAKEKLLD